MTTPVDGPRTLKDVGRPVSDRISDAVAALVSERSFYLTVLPEIQKFKEEWEASKKPKFGYSALPWQKLFKFLVTHPHMRTVRGLYDVRNGTEASQILCCTVVDHYFEEVWGRSGTLASLLSMRRNKHFEEASPWNEVCDVITELPPPTGGVSFDEVSDFRKLPPRMTIYEQAEAAVNNMNRIIFEQERQMSKTDVPKIETRTFIDGIDATTMSDEQLMSLISKLENDVVNLGTIKVVSTKVQKKIADMNDSVVLLAELLDER